MSPEAPDKDNASPTVDRNVSMRTFFESRSFKNSSLGGDKSLRSVRKIPESADSQRKRPTAAVSFDTPPRHCRSSLSFSDISRSSSLDISPDGDSGSSSIGEGDIAGRHIGADDFLIFIIGVLHDVARGLEYLHALRLTHNSVKLSNILVDGETRAVWDMRCESSCAVMKVANISFIFKARLISPAVALSSMCTSRYNR